MACVRCGAHRDPRRAPTCLVCGCVGYHLVAPNDADRDAIEQELLAAAEAVDLSISQTGFVRDEHPAAIRLRRACRNMALARAGRLGF